MSLGFKRLTVPEQNTVERIRYFICFTTAATKRRVLTMLCFSGGI